MPAQREEVVGWSDRVEAQGIGPYALDQLRQRAGIGVNPWLSDATPPESR
ncbi:MAG: hypothetical protein ACRDJC_24035 [Thermomicrobiales bacterium]